jgi:hypothetical protein
MNQQPQQQQQNTVITIPGTNNTIQIPANFAGKLTELLTKRQLAVVHGFTIFQMNHLSLRVIRMLPHL